MSVPPLTSALVLSVTSMMNCRGGGEDQRSSSVFERRLGEGKRTEEREGEERAQTHLIAVGMHVLQNVHIDNSSEVIDVGDKEVFLSLSEELVDEARVGDGVEQVAVAGRVPLSSEGGVNLGTREREKGEGEGRGRGRKRTHQLLLSSRADLGVGNRLSLLTRG